MSDQEIAYEIVAGHEVHPEWHGGTAPIPPQWVQKKAELPRRYKNACLAPQLADQFPVNYYDVATSFVRDWPRHRLYGNGPVFIGPSGTGKTWTSAAAVNEVVMRYTQNYDISTYWFSVSWSLPTVLDAKRFGKGDQYFARRNRILQSDLLVMDNVLAAADHEGGRDFVLYVYDYRHQHQLPTITSLTVEGEDEWGALQTAFGRVFTDRLRQTAKNLIARVG